ncbi:MAG: indolepyruvate oxidoreductase subunit beta [Eubacteriales bacterium]|nr:indolepyruvate oxidoreductase subunit beta [Eubacteriales bacterium]
MKSWNILIVGVGGQGTLLASKILGAVASISGRDVKVSEVHGMAQRGGSVVTHVRIADKVHSPLIEPGSADIILSFEQMEAARYVQYARPGALIAVNRQKILPMPVVTGAAAYPGDVLQKLGQLPVTLVDLDAYALAEAAGNARTVNLVMLGAISKVMDIEQDVWQQAIARCVPPKTVAVNQKAFAAGRAIQQGE